MQGGGETSIIERWKELAEAEPDGQRRSEYAGLALVFADAAGCQPVWKEALKGWNMKQSQQVLEWMAEGRVEGKAQSILQLLNFRFPAGVPTELTDRIRATTDEQQLEHWFNAAMRVASLEEFSRAMQQNGA